MPPDVGSGHVGNDKSRPGVVKNVGVAVEIASASLSVQKLLILPFFGGRHVGFSTSGFAGNCIAGS